MLLDGIEFLGTSSARNFSVESGATLPTLEEGSTGELFFQTPGGLHVFDGTAWTPIASEITLTTSDVAEGTNLYYTDDRARAAISVTGTGGTYDSATGVLTLNSTSAAADLTGTTLATNVVTASLQTISSPSLTFTNGTTERLRVTANGGLSFGASGTAVGTTGQYLRSNGDNAPTWAAVPYDIAGAVLGKPAASAIVFRFVANRAFTVPAALSGSVASAATLATASTVLTLYKNGASFGTMTFAAGQATATLAAASATSFVSGDILTVGAAASQDATFADAQFTLNATL